MKYVVCFSGGHASALAAIETVRKYGRSNVILINHDISPNVEHEDIKRFKQEIANYLNIPITYANMIGWAQTDPLDICLKEKGFSLGNGSAYCASRLKIKPFKLWLKKEYPSIPFEPRDDIVIMYGFSSNERYRIQRRVGMMFNDGYKIDCPLIWKERTIFNTEEIGIERPITYTIFKHANCIGCLKADKRSWYVTYCLRPDIFYKAIKVEASVGYSILKGMYLKDLECKFKYMEDILHIFPDENIDPISFWIKVNIHLPAENNLPCECEV